MQIEYIVPFLKCLFWFRSYFTYGFKVVQKKLLFQTYLKQPGRTSNSHKLLSGPKSEVKYGGGGIIFCLVGEAEVENKIGRILSSYEDKCPHMRTMVR